MNIESRTLLPSYRVINVLGFTAALAALLFAILFLERTLYLDPCPLCIIDRVIVCGIGSVFLIAAIHNPARTGQRVYGASNLLLTLGGLATAGKHVWLQHLPADKVPECGASLAYMLETLPLMETLKTVLRGSGECATVGWTFLGLSLAEQTLLLFVGFFALLVIQLIRH